MFETLTIDVTNVKKILKCCPYYDDIINSDIMYNDDLSIDLIEWYKDIIFSCNGDNEEDIKIDEPMKKHISFRVGGPADILVRPRTEEQL
ncbi:MAG: hypothetical protein UCL21_01005, partial [Bacilli bacterium]|nr:hypothetical protein [Bacilli bacterium]